MLNKGDLVRVTCSNTRYTYNNKIGEVVRVSKLTDLVEVILPGERFPIVIKTKFLEPVFQQ